VAAIEAEVARWRADLAPHFRGTPVRDGDVVLDVIVAPDEPPVVGWHEAGPGRHEGPGGRYDYPIPADIPSRAWRKVVEGLRWAKPPIRKGELVLELGAAPGGGTRAFAEAGLRVIAVDPQPLDAAVVALPGVTVVARRAGDLKLTDLPGDVAWLASDAGIPPNDVLRAIERLRPALPRLRGFLLTLKLNDAGVVKHLPHTFADLRALGATAVHARQLPANRRDIFVYAPVGAG
jgi:23S rRNA C2498 (ribose-2'-O)-methylase RlmM